MRGIWPKLGCHVDNLVVLNERWCCGLGLLALFSATDLDGGNEVKCERPICWRTGAARFAN